MADIVSLTSLARLAVDSGGRFTEDSNDLTLGYARARRDQACVYTIGFYADNVVLDKVRSITVRVRRPGMRAIHPSKFVLRSDSEKRVSQLKAAWLAPEMFQTGVMPNGDPLPDYFFAFCPWLLANAMDDTAFYDSYAGPRTLAIEAIKAIPPFERKSSWSE